MLIESLSLVQLPPHSQADVTPVLVCALSTGTLLHISKIPFAAAADGTLSPSVLQSLVVQKFSTPYPSALKWLYLPASSSSSSSWQVLAIDSAGRLQALALGEKDTTGELSTTVRSMDVFTVPSALVGHNDPLTYTDMVILPSCFTSRVALLLASGGVLQLLALDTLQIVQSFSTAVAGATLDQFVAIQQYFSSQEESVDGGAVVLVSIAHSEEAECPAVVSTFSLTLNSTQAQDSPPVAVVMLLHQSILAEVCTGATPPHCRGVFPISCRSDSDDISSGVSGRLVLWSSSSELSILSCDDEAMQQAVGRLQGGQRLVQLELKENSSLPSSQLALHTDCMSLLGYLSALALAPALCSMPPFLAVLLDHVLDSLLVQSSLAEVMVLARVGLLCWPIEACSLLLHRAKVGLLDFSSVFYSLYESVT